MTRAPKAAHQVQQSSSTVLQNDVSGVLALGAPVSEFSVQRAWCNAALLPASGLLLQLPAPNCQLLVFCLWIGNDVLGVQGVQTPWPGATIKCQELERLYFKMHYPYLSSSMCRDSVVAVKAVEPLKGLRPLCMLCV